MQKITRLAPPGTRTPSVTISFRCTPEQRERWITAAREAGAKSLSEWCEWACDAHALGDEAARLVRERCP